MIRSSEPSRRPVQNRSQKRREQDQDETMACKPRKEKSK